MVIIDSNVIIDIATGDPEWSEWSIQKRYQADARGGAAINDIVFAEICSRYPTLEGVEGLVKTLKLAHLAIPRVALFLAAKAFRQYREAGGVRENVLPDFLIGAQALVLGMPVLTRDTKRYRTYFPTLELITP